MIDGSVLQSAQRCFEKKSRVVVKMMVRNYNNNRWMFTINLKVYFKTSSLLQVKRIGPRKLCLFS